MRPEPLQLTLLRHGRSRADDEKVHEGRYDSPLTPVGITQAQRLAAYWQAHPPGFEHIVCSSLVRARKTAEIVAEALGLTPEISNHWMEFDNGPMAGLAFDKAQEKYPEPQFRHRYEALTQDGGESSVAFLQRAQLGLQALVQSHYSKVLVVAHGGILNMALRDLLQTQLNSRFRFDDTSFAELTLERNSPNIVLTGVNLSPHLTAD